MSLSDGSGLGNEWKKKIIIIDHTYCNFGF